MTPPKSQFARQKLIHAIVFFVENTKQCQKVKLFKLLAYLDWEIFKATGKTVTGLEYSALKFGPVPLALFEELKTPTSRGTDLTAAVAVKAPTGDVAYEGMTFRARVKFDPRWFTAREIAEMKRLAEIFDNALSETMIKSTHTYDAPWFRVWHTEKRENKPIPYEYVLGGKGSISKERADSIAAESDELDALFS